MKKILIVEDEKDIQDYLVTFFNRMGHKDIQVANDGLEAFMHCSQTKFDLITLDHQMPFLRGADFLTALRKKNNLNSNCPVIMISGYIPEVENGLKIFENTFFCDKPDFERVARYARMILDKKPAEKAS